MQLLDLTDDAIRWLNAADPPKAFTEWAKTLPPDVQVGFSGYGVPPGPHPGESEWDQIVRQSLSNLSRIRPQILTLLQEKRWEEPVRSTIREAEALLDDPMDRVKVVVSVGLGACNASMGWWDGRGLAFLWLEHFLDPGSNTGYMDLGMEGIPIWIGHEIGHAVRYAIPGTGALVPDALAESDPWSFFDRLDELPLAERFLDEGLATDFCRRDCQDGKQGASAGHVRTGSPVARRKRRKAPGAPPSEMGLHLMEPSHGVGERVPLWQPKPPKVVLDTQSSTPALGILRRAEIFREPMRRSLEGEVGATL